MKKIIIALLLLISSIDSFACSAISVAVHNSSNFIINVIGARTMDFETGLSALPLSFGDVGTSNISDVNMSGSLLNPLSNDNVAQWNNKYKFIGMSLSLKGNIVDGINNAGLYVGALYLPNHTQYPTYSANNSAKALAVYDLPNYILGNFATVDDAINTLGGDNAKVQVVGSALMNAFTFPLHFMLQDQTGDRAIIEFIDGKMHIYHNNAFDALTNAPTYDWQIKHYSQISQDFVEHNTDTKVDGYYQNGSGMLGLPGDATPTSRLDRAFLMLSVAPTSYNDNQAYYINKTIINSISVGLGVNPAPTLWNSTFNLGTGEYFVNFDMLGAANGHIILTDQTPGNINAQFKHYNIQQMNYNDAKAIHLINAKLTRLVKYVPSSIVKPFDVTSNDSSYVFKFLFQ